MKIFLTIALMLVVTISKAQTSDFIKLNLMKADGTFLTTGCVCCTGTPIGFSTGLPSTSMYAHSQQWSLEGNKLKCELTPGISIYIKDSIGNMTAGNKLFATIHAHKAAKWALGPGNSLGYVPSPGESPTLFINSTPTGIAILSTTSLSLTLSIPLEKVVANQMYKFSSDSFYLVAGPAGMNATTTKNIDSATTFYIKGNSYTEDNIHTLSNAQIKIENDTCYLIGTTSNQVLSLSPQATYIWAVLDNGDETVTFQSLNACTTGVSTNIGYVTNTNGIVSLSSVGGNGQKWKFKKAGGTND